MTLPVYRHPGGWAIVPVHYSMDPDKDPAWAGRERAKYLLQTDWDREMEVDMRAQSGVAAYPHWHDGHHLTPDLTLVSTLPLCVACDFNVKPMVWLVCQVFRRVVHVLDEVIGLGQSVPQLVTEFRNRYPSHTQELWIYGDPAGHQRNAQTAMSDYDQMRLGLATYPAPVVWKVAAGHPPVKDRLAAVNQALRDVDGRAWVHVHPRCTYLIADMQEVVLDGQGGIKKTSDQTNPYSQRTHACLAGDTQILTPRGEVPLWSLLPGDTVLLPTGQRRITATSCTPGRLLTVRLHDGGRIDASKDHRFLTQRGMVTTDALRYNDVILTGGHPLCQTVASSLTDENSSLGLRDAIIGQIHHGIKGSARGQSIYIAISGKKPMGLFRWVLTSIMQMAIPSTIAWRIFSACLPQSILHTMAGQAYGLLEAELRQCWQHTVTKLRRGMPARRVAHGTASMESGHGTIVSAYLASVGTVEHSFLPCLPVPSSVGAIARLRPDEGPIRTMSRGSVLSAAQGLRVINTFPRGRVVASVDSRSEERLVYDLTVEQDHCYVANGMLVSNSDALGYLIAREFPVVERVFRQERTRRGPRVYGAVRGAL